MQMKTREFSRKLAAAKKAASSGKVIEVQDDDTGETYVFASKPRKAWTFAEDAVGMVDGPEDLSQRKGLSA
ncbi:hypothetical protein ASA1KI_11200 [Opitutales bacterium ASA1]|uniref:hypothetical protein n=1 Tax=Congregicoccus parvus TaxID=3081749 RepID=UPI002B2E055C|nr:hypothetical protein ASA1KI_11200 [Opitutales bacterium ASA1]